MFKCVATKANKFSRLSAPLSSRFMGCSANAGNCDYGIKDRDSARKFLDAKKEKLLSEHPFFTNNQFFAYISNPATPTQHVFGSLQEALSQYFFFCRDFTRYVSGSIALLPDDKLRAELTHNLVDECGGSNIEERHSHIFREFLQKAFSIANPDKTAETDHSKVFRKDFLKATCNPDLSAFGINSNRELSPLYSLAFLVGCESIVPTYYTRLLKGLQRAGVKDEALRFWHMHIAGDEEHAEETLQILLDLKESMEVSWNEWAQVVDVAFFGAADLKGRFFTDSYNSYAQKHKIPTAAPVENATTKAIKKYFVQDSGSSGSLGFATTDINRDSLEPLPVYRKFENLIHRQVAKAEIAKEYSAERMHPVYGASLPTATVSLSIGDVYPGEPCSNHRHAYESVLYVIEGEGYTVIEGQRVDWKVGDALFVPPWNWHQHFCKGDKRVRYVLATNIPLLSSLGQTVIRQEEKN